MRITTAIDVSSNVIGYKSGSDALSLTYTCTRKNLYVMKKLMVTVNVCAKHTRPIIILLASGCIHHVCNHDIDG